MSRSLAGDRPPIGVFVLNFNGRALLAECLPSVLAAAEASRHDCQVIVVDNDSADRSVEFLAERFPAVRVERRPNRGLCSFNEVLEQMSCPVAVLLNNDIKLDPACLDHLIEPLLRVADAPNASPSPPWGEGRGEGQFAARPTARRCFMTAPRCWLFDGTTHEGLKTAVRWRWGLVQATSLFAGHEAVAAVPGPTASAGAALAVDRRLFLALGGFDPLYLPGRLEDLDFGFRGYLAGYEARYVPEAIAYHRGMATFGPTFSTEGCDQLALRNTLLFQWKNLRHPLHVLRQGVGLAVRLVRDAVRAPLLPRGRRFATWRALLDAHRRLREICQEPRDPAVTARLPGWMAREAAFFREFHPKTLLRPGKSCASRGAPERGAAQVTLPAGGATPPPSINERLRDRRHPISRWYLLPAADWVASRLVHSTIRPWQVTVSGAAIAVAAGLAMSLGMGAIAALLVLGAWFCDRLDGKLARRQQTTTRWGAWLDANLDELTDLGLHAALALATAAAWQSSFPWTLFTAFVVGKYLFVFGVASDDSAADGNSAAAGHRSRHIPCAVARHVDASPRDSRSRLGETRPRATTGHSCGRGFPSPTRRHPWLRRLYHLPGNADVRTHLLALLVASGWWSAELLLVAVYFNVRWIARYVLVARRETGMLGGRTCAEQARGGWQPDWQTGMSTPRENAA